MLWEVNKSDSGVGLTYSSASTEHDSFISALSINSTSQQAVTASEDNRIKVWNVDELSSLRTLQGHSSGVLSVDYHPAESDVFASTARVRQLLSFCA